MVGSFHDPLLAVEFLKNLTPPPRNEKQPVIHKKTAYLKGDIFQTIIFGNLVKHIRAVHCDSLGA